MTETSPHSTPGTSWTRRILTRHRPLLIATLVSAFLITGIGWWSLDAVRRTLEESLRSELTTALQANVTALDLWIQGQMRTATLLATDPTIRDPANAVLEQARTNGGAGSFSGVGPVPGAGFTGNTNSKAFQLSRVLDERLAIAGYQAAVLVGTNGRVVASSGRMRVRPGSLVPADHLELFQKVLTHGEPLLITPFKPPRPAGRNGPGGRRSPDRIPGTGPTPGMRSATAETGGTNAFPSRLGGESDRGPRGELQVMQILAPIRGANGRIHGVLAVVLRPEAEFTRVLSVARTGSSGETFAFDPEGRLLSQSRFEEQLRRLGLLTNSPGVSSALNLVLRDPGGDLTRGFVSPTAATGQVLMRFVANAVSEPAGASVLPFRDYRGVPVVGAWHWMEEHQFGVVTKIDADEAFRPLRVLRLIFQILLLLVVLAAVVGVVASHAGSVWRRRFDEAQLRARQLGQYTLVEKIGEGAMGVVYRARHALLRRETAVKLLLPQRADEGLIRQFESEVQMTCRLSHPNTIQVFDYGHTADGIFYYAMELLQGLTLQDLSDRHGALPEARAVHLLRQVAGSLQEAHGIGLIHRDIKPGNLFLTQRGGMPDTIKVLDFGLVRDVSREVGSAGGKPSASRFLGTPLYMAPETIQSLGHGDAASDLYALGAVAYLLVTGHPVFQADTVEEAWELHQNAIPVPPNQRGHAQVSRQLESLILDCLAKDPASRPSSMTEFLVRLETSPEAQAWTAVLRREWWARHVKTADREPVEGPLDPMCSEVKSTIRIDLSTRGPGGGDSGEH